MWAAVMIAVLSSSIIGRKTDTGALHIMVIGYVLTFGGLLVIGVIKYRRYKHGYFYTVIASAVTGIGAGILVNSFFDWLY